MQDVIQEDIKRLKKDPLGFAILMDDEDLEETISTFFMVLKNRKNNRGDSPSQPEY